MCVKVIFKKVVDKLDLTGLFFLADKLKLRISLNLIVCLHYNVCFLVKFDMYKV